MLFALFNHDFMYCKKINKCCKLVFTLSNGIFKTSGCRGANESPGHWLARDVFLFAWLYPLEALPDSHRPEIMAWRDSQPCTAWRLRSRGQWLAGDYTPSRGCLVQECLNCPLYFSLPGQPLVLETPLVKKKVQFATFKKSFLDEFT